MLRHFMFVIVALSGISTAYAVPLPVIATAVQVLGMLRDTQALSEKGMDAAGLGDAISAGRDTLRILKKASGTLSGGEKKALDHEIEAIEKELGSLEAAFDMATRLSSSTTPDESLLAAADIEAALIRSKKEDLKTNAGRQLYRNKKNRKIIQFNDDLTSDIDGDVDALTRMTAEKASLSAQIASLKLQEANLRTNNAILEEMMSQSNKQFLADTGAKEEQFSLMAAGKKLNGKPSLLYPKFNTGF